MGEAVGQTLPIAIGLMISPMPIVAVVMMLASRKAVPNGLAFVVGWLVGIGLLGTLVLLLSGPDGGNGSGPPTWASVLKIALGLGLLVLAVRQWRHRPTGDGEPAPPTWMAAIDGATPPKAFGLALLLGAVNPKNLLLVVSAATTIAHATEDRGAQLAALALFTVLGTVGVGTPVVIYLAMGERAAAILAGMRTWLVANSSTIMVVLLLVLGTKVLGDGLSGLF